MAQSGGDSPEDTEALNQRGGSSASPSPSHLGVSTDGFLALDAGVGTDLVEALDAAVPALLLHVLLPLQRVAAVEAVEALRHGAHGVTARPCRRNQHEPKH